MGQPYVGEIRMFGGNFAPAGWMFCNGQLIPISENETLFQLIGTTYGGDGQQTFALPNLQSRVPIHQGSNGTTSYPLAASAGAETVTLTSNQIPNHNHVMVGTTAQGNQLSPANGFFAQPSGLAGALLYAPPDPPNQHTMNANALPPQGGSQPHDNIQPTLVVNFIISMFGIFPSQS